MMVACPALTYSPAARANSVTLNAVEGAGLGAWPGAEVGGGGGHIYGRSGCCGWRAPRLRRRRGRRCLVRLRWRRRRRRLVRLRWRRRGRRSVRVGGGNCAGPVLWFGDARYGVREAGYALRVEDGVVLFSYREVVKSTNQLSQLQVVAPALGSLNRTVLVSTCSECRYPCDVSCSWSLYRASSSPDS